MTMLTVSQAAARLGVTPRRVLNFIRDRRLPASRFGHVWMIAESDLLEFAQVERRTGRPKQ